MNKKGKVFLTTLSLLLGTGTLVGCGDTPDTPVDVVFDKIELDNTTVTINFGGEKTLVATVSANVDTYSDVVTWTSSVPTVATVDATGKVTAVAAGTTVITASIGSVSVTCTVTVLEKVPELESKGTEGVAQIYQKPGYKGRIAIHEIVVMTSAMKNLIEKRASEDEMRKLAVSEGTQMLADSAAALVLEGITTVDEMNRVAYSIDG